MSCENCTSKEDVHQCILNRMVEACNHVNHLSEVSTSFIFDMALASQESMEALIKLHRDPLLTDDGVLTLALCCVEQTVRVESFTDLEGVTSAKVMTEISDLEGNSIVDDQYSDSSSFIFDDPGYNIPDEQYSDSSSFIFDELTHCQLPPAELPEKDSNLQLLTAEAPLVNSLTLTPSSNQSHNLHGFYVRSWCVPVSALLVILDEWKVSKPKHPEANLWRDACERVVDKVEGKVFIRYVGTCEAPSSPMKRFDDDLKSRTSGLIVDFCDALLKACPLAYHSARVFTIKSACGIMDNHKRDDVERILIQFFGIQGLLNRRSGGFYCSYSMPQTDSELFSVLATQVMPRLQANGQPQSDPTESMISWLQGNVNLSLSHPVETRTDGHRIFDNSRQNVVMQQALPFLYHPLSWSSVPSSVGVCLWAFIGKDVTREEYDATRCFLGSQDEWPLSRAGFLTRNFVATLSAIEHGSSTVAPSLFPPAVAPFVDLFPFLGRNRLQDHIRILGDYLRATCPLLVITFGASPHMVLRGHFRDDQTATSETNFMVSVGSPAVATFASSDWITDGEHPPLGTLAIYIPHLDPGYDKYHGIAAHLVERVIMLTWMVTFKIAHCTLDLLDTMVAPPSSELRDDLIRTVLQSCGRSTPDPHLRTLYSELEAAKQNLKNADPRHYQPPVVPPGTSELACKRFRAAGFALGAPGSEARMAQVQQMWNERKWDAMMNLRQAMEEVITRGTYDWSDWTGLGHVKKEWMAWASHIREGSSFMMASMQRCQADVAAIQGLPSGFCSLRTSPPDWAVDDSWMLDPEQVNAAFQRIGQRLQNGDGRQYSRESQQKKAQKRLHCALKQSFRGAPLHIVQDGFISLPWAPAKVIMRLKVPSAARDRLRLAPGGTDCYILFEEDGIRFAVSADDVTSASSDPDIHANQLATFYDTAHLEGWNGFYLHRLWQHERCLINGSPSSIPGCLDRSGQRTLAQWVECWLHSLPSGTLVHTYPNNSEDSVLANIHLVTRYGFPAPICAMDAFKAFVLRKASPDDVVAHSIKSWSESSSPMLTKAMSLFQDQLLQHIREVNNKVRASTQSKYRKVCCTIFKKLHVDDLD